MSRKSKAEKSKEAWERLFKDLVEKKDLARFKEKHDIYVKIYGDINGVMFYKIRYYVFHEIILPEWLKSTNITHRNSLYDLVEKTLGKGLADELQRISSKRTW